MLILTGIEHSCSFLNVSEYANDIPLYRRPKLLWQRFESLKTAIPERKQNILTPRFVETVAQPGRYHDGGGLGLFVHVTANGSKQGVQRVMLRGRRVHIRLGSPPVVTLAMAREAALPNKRAVYQGRDPLAEKRAARPS